MHACLHAHKQAIKNKSRRPLDHSHDDDRIGSVAWGEGVGFVLFHLCERVVDLPMVRFVGPNRQKDVADHSVFGQLPVVPRHRGGREVREEGEVALVDLRQQVAVCYNRLFLEVADEPVCEPRRHHVRNGVDTDKEELSKQNADTE